MTNTLPEQAYKAETTTLALCWKIQRTDGVALGLTAHDRPLRIGSLLYESAPGINPAAIRAAHLDGGTVTEAQGFVSDAGIGEADIRSGRYSDAKVEVFLVDWSNPNGGAMTVTGGYMGEIRKNGSQFTADVRSIADKLDAPACERYSPECRATLGDNRCRVDLSRHEIETFVTGLTQMGFLKLAPTVDFASYLFGSARFLSGQCSGLNALIINHSADGILIRETNFIVETGVRVVLRASCNKQASTCRNRFGNFLNFRGEPNIPGLDTISGYVVA